MISARRIPSQGAPAALDEGFLAFWNARTFINQSTVALTFAQRLTVHEIGTLRPHLRARQLSDLYPATVVPTNFDLRLGGAEKQLLDARAFLFDAAFIVCQPAYEAYLGRVTADLAAALGISEPSGWFINDRHNWLKDRGADLTGPWLEVFTFLREARNARVHGGLVNDRLVRARVGVSAAGEAAWAQMSSDPLPAMIEGETLPRGALDPVAAIYCIGVLGVELNRRIVALGGLTPQRWADMVVLDYRRLAEERWKQSPKHRYRKVRGHAMHAFGLALPNLIAQPALLDDAVDRAPGPVALP